MAASDVWALCAAGSCISVYQNYKRIFYYYDTTYTSGIPGFAQYDGTNITHSQISSWRGYSAVQQDGIWQKQGVTIAPLSGELPIGVQPSATVLYEGNAQILSGTVFKMWFSG